MREVGMSLILEKIITINVILLILFLVWSPLASSKETTSFYPIASTGKKELNLLRGEHYLFVNASDDVDSFHLLFCFPPDYQYQVPIYLEIYNDSTAEILHYAIQDDSDGLNNLINFTIGPMHKDDLVLLHFSCWVVVKNHEFDDLPKKVSFPRKGELPVEVQPWLVSTEQVQVKSILIRHKARQLRGVSNNLLWYAQKVAPFIKYHRYGLFIVALKLGIFGAQDAVTTLLFNGENVGRSHLACALFRTYHIPSRVLLAHNDQGFWTQMHYMVEYYVPEYGWVLLDSTKGQTPYATRRQIINRICFPSDEKDTKKDYILPFMKGEERWLWFDTEKVSPYYVDCDEGSKSQMFYESTVTTDAFTVDYAFYLSQQVYRLYEQHLGKNLTGPDWLHFQTGLAYQLQALSQFVEEDDVDSYIYFMEQAYDEYREIIGL
jgi:hypothetical protein